MSPSTQAIELERLWLWIGNNLAGRSADHRKKVAERGGVTPAQIVAADDAAKQRYAALLAVQDGWPPSIDSDAWMYLPLRRLPDYSILQPQLDGLLGHPTPDAFREEHNFQKSICWPAGPGGSRH